MRKIQLVIPAETQLPVPAHSQNISDFIRIPQLFSFYRNNFLVFVLKFPLLRIDDYFLYRPIPLPLYVSENNAIFIAPETDYIALSDDSEFYMSLDQPQYDKCLHLSAYTLCKGHLPIYQRSSSNTCEIVILCDLQTIPETCKLRYIHLAINLWNRLSDSDSWINCTNLNVIT